MEKNITNIRTVGMKNTTMALQMYFMYLQLPSVVIVQCQDCNTGKNTSIMICATFTCLHHMFIMYVGKFMINIMLKYLHQIFIMYVGTFVENIILLKTNNSLCDSKYFLSAKDLSTNQTSTDLHPNHNVTCVLSSIRAQYKKFISARDST